MSRLLLAIDGIRFARNYTLDMIEHVEPADWYHFPGDGVTHIAWQVGHLAYAEYSLALRRIRGEREDDQQWLDRRFMTLFGKGSRPDSADATCPDPDELRHMLDRVHEKTLEEISRLSENQLDEPDLGANRHPFFDTKFGSLLWCGRHEMVHAGQIGLLRRLLGYPPRR